MKVNKHISFVEGEEWLGREAQLVAGLPLCIGLSFKFDVIIKSMPQMCPHFSCLFFCFLPDETLKSLSMLIFLS